jgi:hypothetical protein
MNRANRWSFVAKNIDSFELKYGRSPLQEYHVALLQLEVFLLSNITNDFERVEVRRRCAERYCMQCFATKAEWNIFREALVALELLGYSNSERCSFFAVLLKNYASSNPEAIAFSKQKNIEALKKLRCLPRNNCLRQYMEERLCENPNRAAAT